MAVILKATNGSSGVAEWQNADVFRGPYSLAYVGQGSGGTKTTTVTDGPTVAEEFQINDQLYFDWGVPNGFDTTQNPTLRVHFYINANEPGKVVSWQLAVGDANGDRVDVIRQTITTADVPVNSEFVNKNADFLINAVDVNLANAVELTFRLTRIASSDDPTVDPRVHLIQVLP